MNIKIKFQLILLPIVIIPVIVTAYTFSLNSSSSIRALNDENMLRNIEIVINHLEQENDIIEKLGIMNTQYYEQNAKEHSLNFISNMTLKNGHIQLYDHPMRTILHDDGLLRRDFYESLYLDITGTPQENIATITTYSRDNESYVIYYQYFKPWDWILTIHMNEKVIYESIQQSLTQILLAVTALFILSGFLLHRVTNQLLSPLDTLMHSVESISHGNYHQQVQLSSNDEFADIGRAFNKMSTTLASTFEELNQLTEELTAMNDELEQRVEDRTTELQAANEELEISISHLQTTQDELVESKKLAALGALVSGIAHELNTPLGNAITTASFVIKKLESVENNDESCGNILKSTTMILNNLNRTSEIINNFKLVAVDQTQETKRKFELTRYLEQVVQNLSVLIDKTHHEINLVFSNEIIMTSYPGVISQIISQLVMNTLEHGFVDNHKGKISIHAYENSSHHIIIDYTDNGSGIHTDDLDKIFEPFYTSRMGKGNSGLGLSIVYNMVTGVLNGRVRAKNLDGGGLKISLTLPSHVKDDKNDA